MHPQEHDDLDQPSLPDRSPDSSPTGVWRWLTHLPRHGQIATLSITALLALAILSAALNLLVLSFRLAFLAGVVYLIYRILFLTRWQWFMNLPKHGQIMTLSITTLLSLAVLSIVLDLLILAVRLAFLAGIIYLIYRLLFLTRFRSR
ncbi:hypothetical protein BST81_10185 [Leptolyngbya sp. 'hensonii']|uniref:hypothetical protein n=1 Tax=Leptolyngbya sp. 'hensonii' TaxID=1922337 RepID=UPI00095027F4|nr:hypothetical protein [Leptolyngbya sp. 'hensonii']OLP18455.1 hypothetical protein BST81_10185 [Leptolyngbya sp. 'hensonii']